MLSRLARFGVVGGAMSLLNYILFIGVIRLGGSYILAATLAWLVTVTTGYAFNRRFTFRRAGFGGLRDLASYVAGYAMQFLISLAGLQVLIGVLRMGPSPAFLVNLALTSGFSFCYMHLAVFRDPDAGRLGSHPWLRRRAAA